MSSTSVPLRSKTAAAIIAPALLALGGDAVSEQDDGFGAAMPEVAERPVRIGVVPGERTLFVRELDDDHALVLPRPLERLHVVAPNEISTSEDSDRRRRLDHVALHVVGVRDPNTRDDVRRHAIPDGDRSP